MTYSIRISFLFCLPFLLFFLLLSILVLFNNYYVDVLKKIEIYADDGFRAVIFKNHFVLFFFLQELFFLILCQINLSRMNSMAVTRKTKEYQIICLLYNFEKIKQTDFVVFFYWKMSINSQKISLFY